MSTEAHSEGRGFWADPEAAPVLVESSEVLRRVCEIMAREQAIGLDTEFVRTRTFFPTLGLIQVAVGGGVYLVDPLGVDDLEPLVRQLARRDLLKVLHSCQEDLETLYYLCGFVPGPVFDTQIAASFLEHGFQTSYQALVESLLGIHLEKGETRSDWIRRPLSPEQLHYAGLDVACLPGMFEILRRELESKGRLGWVEEECSRLETETRFDIDPELAYERMGALWQYSSLDLEILKRLCALREREAMARDLPRTFVMTDKVIKAVVARKPVRLKELAMIEGVRAGEIRRSGRKILSVIAAARQLPAGELPARVSRPPHSRAINRMVDQAKALADARAAELGLSPELLARKKAVVELVHRVSSGDGELPPELAGWRRHAVGDAMLEMLRSRSAGGA